MGAENEEIIIEISESGATATDFAIKRVTRSVENLRLKTANPLNIKMDAGVNTANGFVEMTPKLNKATDAWRGYAEGFVKNSKVVSAEQIRMGTESLLAGNRMEMFSMSAMQMGPKMKLSSQGLKDYNKELASMNKQLPSTVGHFSLFGRIVAVSALSKAVTEVIRLSDAFTNLQNKIRVVIPQQNSLNFITKELVTIANNSRSSLESVATVFSRTSRSVESLGKSQKETLQFTETLSKAIQVGGSTAVEASNAAIQLSQGLASGALKGDELRSVLEQLPVVAQIIADKFQVPVGALRKMGELGKLTSEKIFEALLDATEKVDTKFKKMQLTFGQAWEMFKTGATVAASQFSKEVGVISNVLVGLSKNFDGIVTSVEGLATVITVLLVQQALKGATVAFQLLSGAMMANPWGVALKGVLLLSAALAPFILKMETSKKSIVTWGEVAAGVWETFTGGVKKTEDPLNTMSNKIEGLDDSTKGWLLTVGALIDAFMILNPLVWGYEAYRKAKGDPNAGDSFSMGTDIAKASIEQINENAKIKAHEQRMQAMKDDIAKNMANWDHAPSGNPYDDLNKKGGGRGPSGKTGDDLIRELRDTFRVQNAPESDDVKVLKILESTLDQAGNKQSITGYGTRKTPFSVQSAPQSDWLGEYMRTGKKPGASVSDADVFGQNNFVGKNQVQTMELIIRMTQAIAEGRAEEAKQIELSNKRLDEQLEVEKKLIDLKGDVGITGSESKAAGEREDKFRRDARAKLIQGDNDIKKSFDPNADYKEEVTKLQDYASRHLEDLDKINDRIFEMSEAYQTLKPTFDGIGTSIADAAANALVFGDNMKQSLENIAKAFASQAISQTFQMLFKAGLGAAGIGPGLIGGPGSQPVPGAAPPTILGHASGGFIPDRGFKTGGYTGHGAIGEPAGYVHGKEFVVNSNATARNRATLEAMNAGRNVSEGGKVTIHNYAGVQVEAHHLSRGEVEIMINKGITEKAPGVVAQDIRNPNGKTSKALNHSLEANRRRL